LTVATDVAAAGDAVEVHRLDDQGPGDRRRSRGNVEGGAGARAVVVYPVEERLAEGGGRC
jgi:hypothetical protein